ncbi:hypothetical protein DFH07DRAFT_968035 [Mycena maculata]|uniref:Uncharacterized protein n=1 Tax=Mycena maculata TaxID=230809 RepID=A0AAD7I3S9_9AGAR|nr:hypothetical protein DFH07DRAFT_968035 [Mycena maculata]
MEAYLRVLAGLTDLDVGHGLDPTLPLLEVFKLATLANLLPNFRNLTIRGAFSGDRADYEGVFNLAPITSIFLLYWLNKRPTTSTQMKSEPHTISSPNAVEPGFSLEDHLTNGGGGRSSIGR